VLISWIGAGRESWVRPQISIGNGILIVAKNFFRHLRSIRFGRRGRLFLRFGRLFLRLGVAPPIANRHSQTSLVQSAVQARTLADLETDRNRWIGGVA
jgi:hypothetical protein